MYFRRLGEPMIQSPVEAPTYVPAGKDLGLWWLRRFKATYVKTLFRAFGGGAVIHNNECLCNKK
jgi:hypothetical protein